MWATSKTLQLPWRLWVRAEQEAVLAHEEIEDIGPRLGALFCMAVIGWTPIFVVYHLTLGGQISLYLNSLDNWVALYPRFIMNQLGEAAILILFGAVGSTVVLLGLKPPPASSGPADHASHP
jgi:hypothetical protein